MEACKEFCSQLLLFEMSYFVLLSPRNSDFLSRQRKWVCCYLPMGTHSSLWVYGEVAQETWFSQSLKLVCGKMKRMIALLY